MPAAFLEVRELDPSPEPLVAPALPGHDPRYYSFSVEPQLFFARLLALTRNAEAHLKLVTHPSLARAFDQHAARGKVDDLLAQQGESSQLNDLTTGSSCTSYCPSLRRSS
jgi:hypothetical protein